MTQPDHRLVELVRQCKQISEIDSYPMQYPYRSIAYSALGDTLNWADVYVYKTETEWYLVPTISVDGSDDRRHHVMTRILSSQRMTPEEFQAEYHASSKLDLK